MKTDRLPFQKIVFVCTHSRSGETACSNPERGLNAGMLILEKLREAAHERGLKGKVRVCKSGCFDLCARGPNVLIVDPQDEPILLMEVQAEDVPQIVEKL